MGLQSVGYIAVGATCGAMIRWGLSAWLRGDAAAGRISWGTLIANLVGAYLIGLTLTPFARSPSITPELRLGIVTGFLGSLTTFSSFSAEVVTFLVARDYRTGAMLAILHVTGSLFATLLGMWSFGACFD